MLNKLTTKIADWGTILNLHLGSAYNVKLLTFNKGASKSLTLDNSRERTLYSISGKLKVFVGFSANQSSCTLLPGTVLHINAGTPFELEALEISRLIEISAEVSVSQTSPNSTPLPEPISINPPLKTPRKKKILSKSKN